MLERCIFAGFGGQGTLLIGKLLASAGMLEGREVTWLPSYGPEMRGGTANCAVVLSDRPIASPVVTAPDGVIAMNLPSLRKFEDSLQGGGTLVINSSLTDAKTVRQDLQAVYVPASEIAEAVGNPKGANMVMLGAYLAMRPEIVSIDAVETAVNREFGAGSDGNLRALYAGMEYIQRL